jgi:hypothetical protein
MSRGTENTKQSGKTLYLSIVNAMFTQRVDAGTPDAVPRELTKGANKGKQVFELYFNKITGRLLSVKERENKEFGNSFLFTLDVSTETSPDSIAVIECPISSNYSSSILNRLPNVDLKTDVALTTYEIDDAQKGKKVTGISIRQNGTKIESHYSKESPKGLPQLEQLTVKGKLIWDDTKRIVFYRNYINVLFPPSVESNNATATNSERGTNQTKDDSFDDVPF